MTNDDAISIMNGSNLVEKRVFYKKFFIYMKMSESTYLSYYQRNRDVIVNRANNYYKNDKNRSKEQARDKYRNLSEQENNKKIEYGKNRYCNMFQEKKQRLKECQNNYRKAKKS